jgi:hypothetical protein
LALVLGTAVGVFSLAFAVGALAGYVASPYYNRSANDRPVLPVDAPARDAGAPSTPDTEASAEATSDPRPPKTASADFVQRATPRNILWNSTYLDHPSTNSDPNAFVLVERASEPGGDAENNAHEIGVWYDASRGRWAIFNQHRAPMAVGATFEVVVMDGPNTLVHRATPSNIVGNSTYVDNPLTNGSPDATLAVTQNWNPGGQGNTYNDHPLGVRYDADEKKWVIFNRDREPMPNGAAFNVALLEGAS